MFKNLNGETNLYWVADDWCSSTVTWNTKAVFDKKKKIPGVELEDGKLEFDVTDIVKLWLKNKKHKGESFTIRTGLVLINDDKNSKQILLSNDNGLKRNLLEIQLMDK